MEKLIADILVDIICEKNISPAGEKAGHRKGFFMQKPYLPSKSYLKNTGSLITYEVVEKEVNKGASVIRLPEKAIVTPMAKLLIEEKGLRVEKC